MHFSNLRNRYFMPLLAMAAVLMASCIGEEPLGTECDIEALSLHVDNPLSIFENAYDTLQTANASENFHGYGYVTDSIGFKALAKAHIGEIPLTLAVTKGAKAYIAADAGWEPFQNGTAVDFSEGKVQCFRIVSQDGVWNREYKICVINESESSFESMSLTFTFDGNYALNNPEKTNDDKGFYYIWTETDSANVNELFGNESWKCGNPGFKLSKSSAKPLEYPTIPVVGGGPDGTDCVKLETMDTGAFGRMVNLRIASGSLFVGYFDVANALKNARKATQFGLPFRHKPSKFSVWLKCEIAEGFQDKDGNPVADAMDEPDAYLVVYRNQDEQGKMVLLDGDDVLTSPYIVGMARLPHNYYYEQVGDRTVRRDLVGNTPIHGVTAEWQQFDMDVEYTDELDMDVLARGGYSMIVGFASSWQGAYFEGAIGNKLWIDDITVTCEY